MNTQGSRALEGNSLAELRSEIGKRDREIALLRAKGAADLSTRSEFFASASHDVKQRVHAMKLMARSCVDETASTSGDKSTLARLTTLLEDLDRCLGHILEFARLEGAQLEPQRSRFPLQDLFHGIELEFEHVAKEKGVALVVLATSIQLSSDRAMMMRILENLVSNAIKFTRAKVLLSARRRGAALHIEVRDQGPGIPKHEVGLIFTPFYQAHRRQGETLEGVGLGLAIVKRLSDALDYRIEMRTEPGAGTLVRVVVPAIDLCL